MVRDNASGQLMYLDEDDQEPGGPDENPEYVAESDGFKDAIKEAITRLPEREQLFMALYYQEELNLKEIGQMLGVSESRACQFNGQALGRIRGNLEHWTKPEPD